MAQATTDHDEIRRWADAKRGRPAAVADTREDGNVGIIRIMFPDARNSDHEALEEITWEQFFEVFEKRKLALIRDEDSQFSKLVSRDSAE